jgi:hypothetical protein
MSERWMAASNGSASKSMASSRDTMSKVTSGTMARKSFSRGVSHILAKVGSTASRSTLEWPPNAITFIAAWPRPARMASASRRKARPASDSTRRCLTRWNSRTPSRSSSVPSERLTALCVRLRSPAARVAEPVRAQAQKA